jgi:hypothetical protein
MEQRKRRSSSFYEEDDDDDVIEGKETKMFLFANMLYYQMNHFVVSETEPL